MLLAALSLPDRDREVERSALGLLRSGLDSTEVREAVLLLLERDTVRLLLVAAAVEPLADRPGLVTAVTSATEDPGGTPRGAGDAGQRRRTRADLAGGRRSGERQPVRARSAGRRCCSSGTPAHGAWGGRSAGNSGVLRELRHRA